MKGSRGVPDLHYAGWMTAHILLMPLYSLLTDNNIAFLEPNRVKGLGLLLWAMTQLAVLKMQHARPRFLVPRSLRRKLVGEDFYEYECDFTYEAARAREVLLDNDDEAPRPAAVAAEDGDR